MEILTAVETALWIIGIGTINYWILKCLSARADYMEEHQKSTNFIRFVILILSFLFAFIPIGIDNLVENRVNSWKQKM